MLAILFNLLGIQHPLQAARLLGKLEQSLPLILGQRGLLSGKPGCVLRLSFRLPLRDLELLTGELSLIVLVVVEVRIVGLDAVKEKVASLFEKRIDGYIKSIKGWVCGNARRVPSNIVKRCRKRNLGVVRKGGYLMQEGGEKMGIMDNNRDLDDDVLESQLRLLEAVGVNR